MAPFKNHKIPESKDFLPGEFENYKYWFPKALNATIHPMIHFFMNLEQSRIINRYCHLHPKVNSAVLREILMYKPKYFLWAGADLLNVTSASAKRQMVIIENNSCPSGQKSMPLLDDTREQGGYRLLVERTFKPLVDKRNTIQGGLAVLYDKNEMETSGYAAVIADVFQEPVWWVPFFQNDVDPPVRFVEGVMEIRTSEGEWKPIRAAFRYVTQKPWNRIPLYCKTKILNPVVACLAGGRNKMVASKAYDLFNGELNENGLHINTPDTIWDVSKNEIPFWVKKLGGQAVVRFPIVTQVKVFIL